MKSARLEWCLGELKKAASMLTEALGTYTETPKLYMMRGQIAEELGDKDTARQVYAAGVRRGGFGV